MNEQHKRNSAIEPLWLLVAGYWFWLVWACAGEWSNNQDYNYGWFVPPLALYFLWKRREVGSPANGKSEQLGGCVLAWLIILISLLLVVPIEIVRQTPIHWRPVLWSIGLIAFANTLAVARIKGGQACQQKVFFPAAFVLLGIPWPTFVENAVSFPLMQAVTQSSAGLLQLAGYPVNAAGTTIVLPGCTVGVEEACSGLRSLQTALMVGAAAGELARLNNPARILLLAFAFVMALAGNQVRVLMLALAGIGGGSAAVAQIHDAAGYVVLAILLCGVGLAAWAMKKLGAEEGPKDKEARRNRRLEIGDAKNGRDGSRAGWAVFSAACVAMLLAHGWFWWRGSMASLPKAAMLAAAEGSGFRADIQVPEEILSVLRPDEYRYVRELRNGLPGKVAGYHFYWRPRTGNANQLYHRPDRCMPGAGWRIDGKVEQQTIRLGGRDFIFNIFPFRGPIGPALMLWGAFLNGEPVEIKFNNDVYLNTANLAQFIRTGTRTYSYEVAAMIMPYEGARPTPEQINAFASRVFTATGE